MLRNLVPLLAATAGLATQSVAQVTFTPLGALPGSPRSLPHAVSADGNVVVGGSMFLEGQAWRWTAAGGMEALPFPPGTTISYARALSAAGSTVVGAGYGSTYTPFRWSEAGGVELLPFPSGMSSGEPRAVSADGSIVIGQVSGVAGTAIVRWTASGVQELDYLPGHQGGAGAVVSGDGGTVAGWSTPDTGLVYLPFRWTDATGTQPLPMLPGDVSAYPTAMTADGGTIVGSSTPSGVPVIWQASSAHPLGIPPASWRGAHPMGISGDASIVVGITGDAQDRRAWIWTIQNGFALLEDVLMGAGVNLDDWTLVQARGISADGRTVVGWGMFEGSERGWIATIPAPGAAIACVLLPLLGRRRRP